MSEDSYCGKSFKSISSLEYKIKESIGSGGQGEVYKAISRNKEFAIKRYFPKSATEEQKINIRALFTKGAPADNFLWPKDIIDQSDFFGYVMDLRPPKYLKIKDWLERKVEPKFSTLCKTGFNLANSFRLLHSNGWCYGDINWGNIFVDFTTGEILVCDNDNVMANGSQNMGVKGTLGFMAPEIVRQEAHPSTNTDLFSLAVLLFYIFFLHHPLEGKRAWDIHAFDDKAKFLIYGKKPIFIWDPRDLSNRPVPGKQKNAIEFWSVYPQFFKDKFLHAFGAGLNSPQRRSTEIEWTSVCFRLLNSIINCQNPNCGEENFIDIDKNGKNVERKCCSCGKVLPIPYILSIGKNQLILNYDTRIYRHHTHSDFDIKTVAGQVIQKQGDPTSWGIANLTQEVWDYLKPNGQSVPVPSGSTVPLVKGGRIRFGMNEAIIT